MKRFLVSVQYNGSYYSGWSRQVPEKYVKPGVEHVLLTSLEKFLGKENFKNFFGSSRTDRGVHALRNYFHVDIDSQNMRADINGRVVKKALNHFLCNENVTVIDCKQVPVEFNCRTNATSRSYMYRLINTPNNFASSKQWVFQDDLAWNVKGLNIESMNRAAGLLTGIHDYSSFRNADCQSSSPYRHIWSIKVNEHTLAGIQKSADGEVETARAYDPYLMGDNRLVTVTITGNAFLYRMVRNMVGTLVHVGLGKIPAEEMTRILEARDRSLVPAAAPARGLFLCDVTYNEKDIELYN